MAPLDEFQTILKDVVQAKRLSASKMGKLIEIAMKSLEDDTHIVSILYRTHKSLPAAAKVSSLYVFDALSRAAKAQAVKQNLTGDINSKNGNAATFLLKVEGVLDGLFQDMIAISSSESKEKTKKVLDIWVKGSTFPPDTLTRLLDVVKETEKEKEREREKVIEANAPPTDPRPHHVVIPPTITPPARSPPAAVDPQSALLALLTQVVSVQTPTTGQIRTNSDAQLDAAQLTLLHQLAQTAKLSSGSLANNLPSYSQRLAAEYEQPHHAPVAGSSQSPIHSDEHTSFKDTRFNRYGSPDQGRRYADHYDSRGGRGQRGANFRSRGRNDSWSNRDDHFGDIQRRRNSRSRSPTTRNRLSKPYSPPRRSANAAAAESRNSNPVQLGAGLDEFGREIRPQETVDDVDPSPSDNHTAASSEIQNPPSIKTPNNHDAPLPIPEVTKSPLTVHSIPVVTSQNELGMENFNIATFDFTSPTSWEALGKMWHVTYGEMPSTDQLMQFVMTAGTAVINPAVVNQPAVQPLSHSTRGGPINRSSRGRGGFSGGRGGHTGLNGSGGQGNWGEDGLVAFDTDAIVLGENSHEPALSSSPVESHGRMQKVDGKWMFVRGGSGVGVSS